ncbi:MAG: DUF3786 domain-containing protein [Chloroflexota bacterium]
MTTSSQEKPQVGYELAYRIACERLAGIASLEEQCRRSDSECQLTGSHKLITVEYLNRSYRVTLPPVEVRLKDSPEEVPLTDKILILHHLLHAQGTPLTGKLVSYKELPGGNTYFPNFSARAIRPLVKYFGREPERLLEAARELGGQQVEYGNVAVTVKGFRRVPITVVLWRGDDEFPPEGNFLFDRTAPDYLSTDDINVLCETIARRLRDWLASGEKRNESALSFRRKPESREDGFWILGSSPRMTEKVSFSYIVASLTRDMTDCFANARNDIYLLDNYQYC